MNLDSIGFRWRNRRRAAALAVVLALGSWAPAFGQPPADESNPLPSRQADARCRLTLAPLLGAGVLPRTTASLGSRAALTVVALGSSSTQGYGSSTPDKAYPPQLAGLLRSRFPASPVTVVNKGVGGETIEAMVARLDRDVFALKPQLVIWQTGTNDAMDHVPPERFRAALLQGLAAIRRHGVDVILMSPQFAPQFVAAPHYDQYLDIMRTAAVEQNVILFRRFTATRRWSSDQRFHGVAVIGPDGLHQTDAAYRCTAVLLADAITGQVREARR